MPSPPGTGRHKNRDGIRVLTVDVPVVVKDADTVVLCVDESELVPEDVHVELSDDEALVLTVGDSIEVPDDVPVTLLVTSTSSAGHR